MKALTLWNPWAVFMADGQKTIETRSWGTRYRGPLAIHAAKMTREHRDICMEQFYRDLIRDAGYKTIDDLPSGEIVAIGRLANCYCMTAADIRTVQDVAPDELALGDWSPGRYAWVFEIDKCLLDDPIPARGYQGLWDWESS